MNKRQSPVSPTAQYLVRVLDDRHVAVQREQIRALVHRAAAKLVAGACIATLCARPLSQTGLRKELAPICPVGKVGRGVERRTTHTLLLGAHCCPVGLWAQLLVGSHPRRGRVAPLGMCAPRRGVCHDGHGALDPADEVGVGEVGWSGERLYLIIVAELRKSRDA